MRAQSVSPRRARGRDRRRSPPAARTGRARPPRALGPLERRESAANQQLIPACAVLIEQQDRLAGRTRARAAPATPESPSARRGRAPPAPPARARRGCGRDAARLRRARPHPVVAGRRRVAFVEDQVDDFEDRRQPARRARRRAGLRTAPSRRPASAWRGRCAARSSASETRNARAISSVVRPPSSRSVSATRASVDSTG